MLLVWDDSSNWIFEILKDKKKSVVQMFERVFEKWVENLTASMWWRVWENFYSTELIIDCAIWMLKSLTECFFPFKFN